MEDLTPSDQPRLLGFLLDPGASSVFVPMRRMTVLYGLNGAGKTRTLAAIEGFFAGNGQQSPTALVQLATDGHRGNEPWWEEWKSRGFTKRFLAANEPPPYPVDEGREAEREWVARYLTQGGRHREADSALDAPERLDGLLQEWASQRLVLVSADRGGWVSWPALITTTETPWANREVALQESLPEGEVGSSHPDLLARVEGTTPEGQRVLGLCRQAMRPREFPGMESVTVHVTLPYVGLRLAPRIDDFSKETTARLSRLAQMYDEEEVEIDGESVTLSPRLEALRKLVEATANANYAGVLQDAPKLTLSATVVGLVGGMTWSPMLDSLSSAQASWASWAIRDAIARVLPDAGDLPAGWERDWGPEWDYTTPLPGATLTIIDEPERALHRSAESHMASFLDRTATTDDRYLVATHSPELLDLRNADVIEVRRVEPVGGPFGGLLSYGQPHARLAPLTTMDSEAMNDLGLTPSDLLRRQRGFLLVEGQHDLDVLEILIGDELRDLRIDVLPLRGATQLSATRSRFLFDYTDAHVFIMLDNLHTEHVVNGWERVRALRLGKGIDAARAALGQEFSQSRFGKGTEIRVLTEFLSACLDSDNWGRVTPIGLTEGDIIEYLPVRELVGGKLTWEQLRQAFQEEMADGTTRARNFKAWLPSRGASITDEAVRDAAKALDHIPKDFERLLKTVEAMTSRS